MVGLPKSIIKKYGVTKKAWQVYRSGGSGSARTKTRGVTMAKRRVVRRRSGGARMGGMGGLIEPIMMGAIYGAVGKPLLNMAAQRLGGVNPQLTRAGISGVVYMLVPQA